MVEPRKAVVCIVSNEEGEVLMGRRNLSLRFMPGHHIFPGGRVDDDEGTDHVVEFKDEDEAIAVKAAAREVFEETGLLLTQGPLPEQTALRRAREDLLGGRKSFDDILSEFGLTVNAGNFEPAGKWTTPATSPIRFDTRYFHYRHTDGQREELIEGELIALDWLTPKEARRLWQIGSIKVSTPVACTLRRMTAAPYPEFLDALREPPIRRPGLPDRELRRGIHSVPLVTSTIPPATHTNCLLVGEEELLIIDPGADDPEELAHLQTHLDHMMELGSNILAVLLTHSHRDHIGGVGFIRDRYDVPVWAHEQTDAQVDFVVDRHVADDEIIELPGDPGWRLRALHTPGHDPGHLSFYEESTRTLICGDMIANPGTIVVSEAYGGNMDDFLASLERLKTLTEATLIVPAHGLSDPRPVEKLQEHIDHRLWREAKIKDAYEAGATSLDALLAKAYDDVPDEALPLAEHALKAHLTRLGLTLDE